MNYKIDKKLKGRTVWTKDGKIILAEATDKQLEALVKMGYEGITKVEKKASKKDEQE